jgi:hypothetical protein
MAPERTTISRRMMSLPSDLQQWDVGAICRENDTLFKSFCM